VKLIGATRIRDEEGKFMTESATPKTRRTKPRTPATGADAAAGSDLSPKLQRSQAGSEPSDPAGVDTLTAARGAGSIQSAQSDIASMIAEAAYFRAERRGFTPGYEIEDWIAAEIELKARLDESDKRAAADLGG
jgi:hypothetical protein